MPLVTRPPLALDRLEALSDGRLAYRLKHPWRDGTTHVLMERRELLERLAPLIPPPRAHQVHCHGVLAPCASGRDRVVPAAGRAGATGEEGQGPPAARDGAEARQALASTGELAKSTAALGEPVPAGRPSGSLVAEPGEGVEAPAHAKPVESRPVPARRGSRLPWSDLLQRIFGVDALRCPCGRRMRVLAAITDPAVAQRILVCMGLPPRAPPVVPASSPDPVVDSWLEGPAAADFDQTRPDDWGPGG